jgi:prophage regulatory protein
MSTRILRLPEVMQTVGLSRSAIYEKMAAREFPKGIPLAGRAVGWLDTDISEWITKQVRAGRHAA